MPQVITKKGLREVLADVLREHRGDAPGDCADVLIETLERMAPRAFVDERLDLDGNDKYTAIAREMILAHAYDVSTWEINAAYPRLSDDEVQVVDDLIGQSSITIEF